MAIRKVETVVEIGEDRRLVVQLPGDIPVGAHHVVAILDEVIHGASESTITSAKSWTFPVLANAAWPANMPLTRDGIYDDDGR